MSSWKLLGGVSTIDIKPQPRNAHQHRVPTRDRASEPVDGRQAGRMVGDVAGFRVRRDLPALVFVAAAIWAAMLYRHYGVEPRFWSAVCIAKSAPFGCSVRMGVLWLQGEGLWGWAALVLGLLAFLVRRFPLVLAAVIVGGAAVVNFNASFGALGAALGVWTWLRLPPAAPPG